MTSSLENGAVQHSTFEIFMIDAGSGHPASKRALHASLDSRQARPTLRIALSLIYGKPDKGMIVDQEGRMIGKIISSLRGRKFYVSVGHRISPCTASQVVERCQRAGHPAPRRQAHLD